MAVDKVKDPAWVQGLASSGKKLNYAQLTEKVFEKLNLGIELSDILEDLPPPQPLGGEMMGGDLGGIEAIGGAAEGIPAGIDQGLGLGANGEIPGMGMG